MPPRAFRGKDLDEALRAVRAALGPDALILETRTPPSREGSAAVEILADDGGPDAPAAGGGLELKAVRDELAEIKSLFYWLMPALARDGVLAELLTQGLPADLVTRLARESGGSTEREQVRRALIKMIPTGELVGPAEAAGQPCCVALVGPPGVGKTTTVLKLTVVLSREGNRRRVGWITADDRGLGSAEQLAVYGRALDVPCEAVHNRRAVADAVARLAPCDVLLVDTPGVSPGNEEELERLSGILDEFARARRALLLDAGTNRLDMEARAKFYGRIGIDSLIFTKVDMCRHFGPLISTAAGGGPPVSYLGTGPKAARGLEAAGPEALARLVLP